METSPIDTPHVPVFRDRRARCFRGRRRGRGNCRIVLWPVMLVLVFFLAGSAAGACSRFVASVDPAKEVYQKDHRLYPVPREIAEIAVFFMPRLFVHPESWHPIDFDDYLAGSDLIRRKDGKRLTKNPSAAFLSNLSTVAQCDTYLKAGPVSPRSPAPIYIQVYKDESPADASRTWLYIKYNLVFDWSGLPKEISLWSRIGAFLAGGDVDRWHRLDVHVSAILAFDAAKRLRLMTLAQHNHQQTSLAGVDFSGRHRPMLAAAYRSNELYPDRGETEPVRHRVVPFFDDVAYLIDPEKRPMLWATDVTYGRNAGGREVALKPVFIEPRYPLADFSGLLAPPRRFFGYYIGRDGPPGANYYAPPAYIPLVDFAAMGFWREGDMDLLTELTPLIRKGGDRHDIDWGPVVRVMRKRIRRAIRRQDPERRVVYRSLNSAPGPAGRFTR